MQKTFCDKCGKEMPSFDYVHVEYSGETIDIGKVHIFKNLCSSCKKDFVSLLNGFITEHNMQRTGCTCPLIDDHTMGINPLCMVHGELANR